MSTRSSIAVQHSDGTVSAIYCHFDGYIEGVGLTLHENFNDDASALNLVMRGNLSTVHGGVEAYADRGEAWEDNAPKVYESFEQYKDNVQDDIGSNGFCYIFREGAWHAHGDSVNRSGKTYKLSRLIEIRRARGDIK